ncbi:hypothetical protein KCU83_g8621, partial [Aureobasidium melanogenum]
MADPQATAIRSHSDYLLRIKTDTKELSSKQHEAQRKIDAIKAQIDREGPTATLEARMQKEVAAQKSVCIRSDIAISIIGKSIEDLAHISRNPPSVGAARARNLDPVLRPGDVGCGSEKVIKESDQARGLSGHRGLTGYDRGHIKKLAINIQKKIEELFDDARDLEAAVDGGDRGDGRKSEKLYTNGSSDSKKRSSSASDDETNIKRRRS